jgi:hypothetical protein
MPHLGMVYDLATIPRPYALGVKGAVVMNGISPLQGQERQQLCRLPPEIPILQRCYVCTTGRREAGPEIGHLGESRKPVTRPNATPSKVPWSDTDHLSTRSVTAGSVWNDRRICISKYQVQEKENLKRDTTAPFLYGEEGNGS